MKNSTKIWILIFIVSNIVFAIFSPFLFSRISNVQGLIKISFDVNSYVAISSFVIAQIAMGVIFFKILQNLSMPFKLFFATVPLTLTFVFLGFSTYNINNIKTPETELVKSVLNISNSNNNNLLWTVIITILYLIILLITFLMISKPIKKIEKAVERLSDGRVRNNIEIGGGKQFRHIEFSLNKINDNYKEKDNLLKKNNVEYEKNVPKKFIKYLGKDALSSLEIGNSIKKEVTVIFCNIRNANEVNKSVSLEDNFNHINSYLKIVLPIIKRYNGFIDKYLKDGILAVFVDPLEALECSKLINKTIKNNNLKDDKRPSLDVSICVDTTNLVFGIDNNEDRRVLTIIDSLDYIIKMEELNKKFGTNIIFTKGSLNNLSSKYMINYRYIGSYALLKKGKKHLIYENVETYPKKEREVLIKNKSSFENAVKNFDNGKYELAKKQFKEVLKQEKKDKVCYAYYNLSEERLK